MGCISSRIFKRKIFTEIIETSPQHIAKDHLSTCTNDSSYDWLIKMILVGPRMSGKSTMLCTITDSDKPSVYEKTIGVEFGTTTFSHENKRFKIQVWDTAGDLTMQSITSAYYRGASIIAVVYTADNDKTKTQNQIEEYFNTISTYGSEDMMICVIKNSPGKTFKYEKSSYHRPLNRDIPYFVMDVNSKKHIDLLFEYVIPRVKTTMHDRAVACKKPAIYVYGKKGDRVDVELKTDHTIIKEIPNRTDGVWRCEIEENGAVIIDGESFPYIFWEASMNLQKVKDLLKIGELMFDKTNFDVLDREIRRYLSPKEADDFREFWESELMNQRKPYVKAEFVSQRAFDVEFPLTVSKRPVSVLRLECVFSFHDEMHSARPKVSFANNLYRRIEPQGDQVSIVEWGGMMIYD